MIRGVHAAQPPPTVWQRQASRCIWLSLARRSRTSGNVRPSRCSLATLYAQTRSRREHAARITAQRVAAAVVLSVGHPENSPYTLLQTLP